MSSGNKRGIINHAAALRDMYIYQTIYKLVEDE